jgi:hypothetical protein
MNGFVATGSPTGALLHPQCMVGTANEEAAAADLLEMAFEAQIGITNTQ